MDTFRFGHVESEVPLSHMMKFASKSLHTNTYMVPEMQMNNMD